MPQVAMHVLANPQQPPKFLDTVLLAIRSRHYGGRTEKAYLAWVRRFILFHNKRHPAVIGKREINTCNEANACYMETI
jgi:hypothetical protein